MRGSRSSNNFHAGFGGRSVSLRSRLPDSGNGTARLPRLLTGAALLLLVAAALQAAPQAELWPRWEAHDPSSTEVVDHSDWASILDGYLVTGHPSGVNRFRYGEVSGTDRDTLQEYIESLEATPVSELNRDEQYAYWFNFYNALTVELILDNYPLDSIRDIGGLFSQGPFDKKLATVEGEEISLNDIEHRILRPIWKDPRIHYGVNCASIGCPNLLPEPFTGTTVDRQLEEAAAEYINHPRGVSVGRRRLTLSSIYDWFQADFDGSLEGVLAHLREYAEEELQSELRSPPDNVRFEYDWSLNEP
jgi:hypothetical protein